MRLDLRLNGWPPLASHLTALLVGVALAHLSWKEGPPPIRLPPKSVTFVLSQAATQRHAGRRLGRNMKVDLLDKSNASDECRLSRDPWVILDAEPLLIVSSPLANFLELSSMAKSVAANQVEVVPASAKVAMCFAKPKVTYGSSN